VVIVRGWVEPRRSEVVDDPIGACGGQYGIDFGRAQRQNRSTRGFAGTYACRRVFHDEAIGGRELQEFRSLYIRIGVGLEPLDVGGGDQMFWPGQTGDPDAHFGERARARRDDGPALEPQRVKQAQDPGQRYHTVGVFDLPALHLAIFGLVIGVREEFAKRDHAGPPVSAADDLFRYEAVEQRPPAPATSDGRSGIDQHSVEIKQDTESTNVHPMTLIGFAPAGQPTEMPVKAGAWGGRRGLNPRHSVPQTDALPAELLPPLTTPHFPG
jgi:hypothetical protein